MIYDLSALSSTADCDAMITVFAHRKSTRELQKANLISELNTYSGGSEEFDVLIANKLEQIASSEEALNQLVDGPAKEATQMEHNRLHSTLSALKRRAENYGPFANFERQSDIGLLEVEVSELAVQLNLLNTKRAELEAVVPNP